MLWYLADRLTGTHNTCDFTVPYGVHQNILRDRTGLCFQPPQYFAVHPAHRGRGHGRALWRASMAWGRANGAAYKILQAALGSPAEQLYLSEGLRPSDSSAPPDSYWRHRITIVSPGWM